MFMCMCVNWAWIVIIGCGYMSNCQLSKIILNSAHKTETQQLHVMMSVFVSVCVDWCFQGGDIRHYYNMPVHTCRARTQAYPLSQYDWKVPGKPLIIDMYGMLDTEVLLRPRRRWRTEFFQRLGRRACREVIVWLLKWPRVPTSIVSRAD